jgi:hypothetical protein
MKPDITKLNMKMQPPNKLQYNLIAVCICLIASLQSQAQPCPGNQVTVSFGNVIEVNDSTIDVPIFIQNSGSTTLKLQALAGGFTYNTGLVPAGSTMTASILPANQPNAVNFAGLSTITAVNHQVSTNQIRWQQSPVLCPSSVFFPATPATYFTTIRLSLVSSTPPTAWPAGFALQFAWNIGLPAQTHRQVIANVCCDGNTNGTPLSEILAGVSVLVNPPNPTILNNPTPVGYKLFDVKKTTTTNIVAWTTSNEVNCSHFNVQHSTDGVNYKTISRVDSKAPLGQSAIDINYSLVDNNPKMGYNYYRLEQVDLDGQKHMSRVVYVYWSDLKSVNIYPNPVTDFFNVEIESQKAAIIEIKVTDATGKLLKTIKSNVLAGVNKLNVNMQEFAAGAYFVQVLENGKLTLTKNITKQ